MTMAFLECVVRKNMLLKWHGGSQSIGLDQHLSSRRCHRVWQFSRLFSTSVDHYQVLGVSHDASRNKIIQAFLRQAFKSREKLPKLAQSAEVLLDAMKRIDYDNKKEIRMVSVDADAMYNSLKKQVLFGSLILTKAFKTDPLLGLDFKSGSNVHCQISIDFDQMLSGVEKDVQYEVHNRCSTCGGSGSREAAESHVACHYCSSTGAALTNWKDFNPVKCPACSGSGSIVKSICRKCNGSGVESVKSKKKIVIKIPVGLESGANVRIAGMGNAGQRGGNCGDLIVEVNVLPHKIFRRQGDDLHLDVPLTLIQGILGAKVNISLSQNRKVNVSFPPGTGHNETIKVLGFGAAPSMMRQMKSALVIHTKLLIPKNLKKNEKQVFRHVQQAIIEENED